MSFLERAEMNFKFSAVIFLITSFLLFFTGSSVVFDYSYAKDAFFPFDFGKYFIFVFIGLIFLIRGITLFRKGDYEWSKNSVFIFAALFALPVFSFLTDGFVHSGVFVGNSFMRGVFELFILLSMVVPLHSYLYFFMDRLIAIKISNYEFEKNED